MEAGSVVKYNGKYFLLWNVNSSGKAQLINEFGEKFSGTPSVSRLEFVKTLPIAYWNNCKYVIDKRKRIFSLATGKEVYRGGDVRERLLERFQGVTV